jgi:glycosyltransferase involved in cell wall biosynthesis
VDVEAGRARGGVNRDAVAERPVKVLRVIARLNMGGPARHVSLLSGRMDPARFQTTLVAGRVGRGEASLAGLASGEGADLRYVPTLAPDIAPLRDLRALVALIRIARRMRPDVVATHTAKAGLLGRVAALAVRPRPVIVHTYHGHVLEGYFGRVKTGVFRFIERTLGRASDCLIAVSAQNRDDLVRLRVAPAERFRVVALGLDLDPFLALERHRGGPVREELGLAPEDVLVTFVGRLVPIKRVDVLLRAFAEAVGREPRLRLAVVGDGELRRELEQLARSLGLTESVAFLGYREDLEDIAAAADVAALTSDNEGTPVSLIEAAAAGLPLVATDAGGVAEVVPDGCGFVVARGDHRAVGDALARLAADPALRTELGARAREHARGRYRAARLVHDIEALYGDLLGRAA